MRVIKPTGCGERLRVFVGHVGGVVGITAQPRVFQRRGFQVAPREPLCGAPVQFRDLVAVVTVQLAAEIVREQVVKVEPLALGVKAEQAQVVAFDPAQQLAAARTAADLVAQVGADGVADARSQHQVADVVGLVGKDLLGQVAAQLRRARGEARDIVGRVGSLAQGERRQLQHGRPSVGAFVKARRRVRVAAVGRGCWRPAARTPRP